MKHFAPQQLLPNRRCRDLLPGKQVGVPKSGRDVLRLATGVRKRRKACGDPCCKRRHTYNQGSLLRGYCCGGAKVPPVAKSWRDNDRKPAAQVFTAGVNEGRPGHHTQDRVRFDNQQAGRIQMWLEWTKEQIVETPAFLLEPR